MARSKGHDNGYVSVVVVFVTMALALVVVDATPPGIANNPSHARCMDDRYKTCKNLEHVCPKFCPDSCYVDCVSCKPQCGNSTTSSTPPTSSDSPPPPLIPSTSPSPPPPSTTPTITFSPPPPPPPPSTTPLPSAPSPPTPSSETPTPPTNNVTPPPEQTPPTTPLITPPSPSSDQSPSTPPPPPPPDSSEAADQNRARCRNKDYPQCYNRYFSCPSACPSGCLVDCKTCKAICPCDQPGAVCQDPRFIGGDGITFYFHGKKDQDFCLVADSNLHINAHFIGKRGKYMKRDFTWVESIGILFGKHQLFIGAMKTSTWDDSIDRLTLSFDGEPIDLAQSDSATWHSETASVTRVGGYNTNVVVIEVEGKFRITARVVPITKQDSKVHNYGITEEDCFAHLDLSFKFHSLTNQVDGVLGQTYRAGYVSRVKIGANMPIMGGDDKFATSRLFAPDCDVAQFSGAKEDEDESETNMESMLELPSLSCSSRVDGRGVVCKR